MATPVAPAATPKPSSVISASRVRRHLDKYGVNYAATVALKTVNLELKPYEDAERRIEKGDPKMTADGKPELDAAGKQVYTPLTAEQKAECTKVLTQGAAHREQITAQRNALGRERVRFSGDSCQLLAHVLDLFTQQLVEHAMNNVLSGEKKIIQVEHVRAKADQLNLFPLFSGLPSWLHVPDHVVKRKGDDAEETHVEVPTDDKSNFKFYVRNICSNYIHDGVDADGKPKKSQKYGEIRTSKYILEYVNLLVVEFIQHLSVQLGETLRSQGIKTVTDDIIMGEIRKMLLDCYHRPEEAIALKTEEVPDPVKVAENKEKPADKRVAVDTLPKVKQIRAHLHLNYSKTRFGELATLVAARMGGDAPKEGATEAPLRVFHAPSLAHPIHKPAEAKPAAPAEAKPAAPAEAKPAADAPAKPAEAKPAAKPKPPKAKPSAGDAKPAAQSKPKAGAGSAVAEAPATPAKPGAEAPATPAKPAAEAPAKPAAPKQARKKPAAASA